MDNLHDILKNSNSMSDIARAIFGKENYTNREKCKKILEENNIDWKQWLKSKERHNYCLQCGKEILGVDRFRKKFCNSSCAASFNNRNVNRHRNKQKAHCLNCGKEINSRNKFCNNTCHAEYERRQYIERWKQGKETGIIGTDLIATAVRKYLFEKHNNSCELCGWNQVNPYTGTVPLQIHHIDGNCKNNSEENLQLLCPNCHALTDNYGSRNKNATRIDRRTKYYRESQNK